MSASTDEHPGACTGRWLETGKIRSEGLGEVQTISISTPSPSAMRLTKAK